MELALTSRVLVAARLTPSQKADLIVLLKEFDDRVVLAIGDGVNDVAML
jgi:phospholipid-transporting ATPase